MTEVPPGGGGVSTFAATGALNSIEYTNYLDKFVVMTTGNAGVRSYLTWLNYFTDLVDKYNIIG